MWIVSSHASAYGCLLFKYKKIKIKIKIKRGGVVAQRKCLNSSTTPMQAPTTDAKLATRGVQNQPGLLLYSCIVKARPTEKKLYCARKWTNQLPHCQAITSVA